MNDNGVVKLETPVPVRMDWDMIRNEQPGLATEVSHRSQVLGYHLGNGMYLLKGMREDVLVPRRVFVLEPGNTLAEQVAAIKAGQTVVA
jgi:hypothetical protein